MKTNLDKNLFDRVFSGCSPSSREYSYQGVMKDILKSFGYHAKVDACGNLYTLPQSSGRPVVLVMAHSDQVALQVKEITQEGFLKFRKIGGIDIHSFYGQEVTVLHKDRQVTGIIGRDPRDINESESGFTISTKNLWIDIGVSSREQALEVVALNDMAVFSPKPTFLGNNLIASPACDDRAGVYCVIKLAELIMPILAKLPFEVCFALSAQEEIGCRGSKALSFRYKPTAAIIIDVEYANDFPGGKGDIVLGAGPVITDNADNNPMMVELARSTKAVHQYAFTSEFYGSTDAESFITHSPDTSVLGIGIPVRNMHSAKEVLCKRDLSSTVELIWELINALSKRYEEGGIFQGD